MTAKATNITPLKKARVNRGLTTREVADGVGIDQSQLNRVENSRKRASPELANRLEKFFGKAVTRDQILYPEDYVDAPTRKFVRSVEQLQEAS